MKLSAVLWDHRSAISLILRELHPQKYSCGDIFVLLSVDNYTAVLFGIPLYGQDIGEVSS